MTEPRFATEDELEKLKQTQGRFASPQELQSLRQQKIDSLNPQTANLIQQRQTLSEQQPFPIGGTSPRMSMPVPPIDNKLVDAALRHNIDLTTGLQDSRLREGVQMAADDAFAIDFLSRNGLEAKKVKDAGVIWRNPKTGLWSVIDEIGPSKNDLLVDPRDEAIRFGPEVVGAAPGAALSPVSGPLAAGAMAAGGSAGAALGEYFRSARAKSLGVQEPSNIGERMDIAARDAAIWGLATDATVGAAQAIRFFFNPAHIALDPVVLKNAMESLNTQDARVYENTINETLAAAGRKEQLQLTLGQLSDDISVLGDEAAVLGGAFRNSMLNRHQQNKAALEAYLDVISPLSDDVTLRQGADGANQVGQDVIDVVKASKQRDIKLAQETIESAEQDGFHFVSTRMDQLSDEFIGASFRDELEHSRSVVKRLENYRYSQARDAYGYDPINATSKYKIPWTKELGDSITRLNNEMQTSLFTSDAAGKKAIAGGLKQNQEVFMVDPSGEVVNSFRVGEPMDLDAAVRGLQHLGRLKRAKVAGEVATDPAGKDIIMLERHLKNAIRQQLTLQSKTNPDAGRALHMLTDAWDITRYRANAFDSGIVGKLLTKGPNNGYQLSNKQAMSQFFLSADRDSLDQVANIAFRKSPRMKNEMRRLIFATYRKQVAPDGVPNIALHKKFMRNHGDLIDTFFPQNSSRIKSDLAHFPKAINEAQQSLSRLEAQINSRTGNKIVKIDKSSGSPIVTETVNADDLAKKTLSGTLNSQDVGDILNILNSAGEKKLISEWKGVLSERIRRQVISGKAPAFSVTKIDNLLDHESTLIRLYGGQYVRNLRTLKEALIRHSKREPSAFSGNAFDQITNALLRPVFRPLSRKGLIRTAALTVRRHGANRIAADVLSNPAKLNAFTQLRYAKPGTPRAANLLAQIGANDLESLPIEFEGEQ